MRFSLHADNTTWHFAGGRRVQAPPPDAIDIDLSGCQLQHGLLNAHDHLELNHYPRTKFRERYDNAHQWGEDVDARLGEEPFSRLRSYSVDDRCFIGGVKNLLNGVTTVVHHGPLYRPLRRRAFPVRVWRQYGWAHSLHFETVEQVQESYRATPPDVPWFIHLAEGTDGTAKSEYQRLVALGCAGENTVLVHGVGLTPEDMRDAARRVRGVVVCPTTNRYLLRTDPDITAMRAAGLIVGVGSDSRLTAEGDLLAESGATEPETQAANWALLGSMPPENDVVAFRGVARSRTNIALVMVRGLPVIGEPDVMRAFRGVRSVPATVDGVEKRVHIRLAQQVRRRALREPGFAVGALPCRLWFFSLIRVEAINSAILN